MGRLRLPSTFPCHADRDAFLNRSLVIAIGPASNASVISLPSKRSLTSRTKHVRRGSCCEGIVSTDMQRPAHRGALLPKIVYRRLTLTPRSGSEPT